MSGIIERGMDRMEIRQDEDDTMILVYKASMSGCVLSLNELTQKHPLILKKVSLTTFAETPLHISALLGHLEFTKILLVHNPKLAAELDSSKRSALHLASAEGHKEIVQVLIDVYDNACLFHDEDGRIPLHYAAMRGRVEVLKELIRTKPESIYVTVLNKSRNTVLQLCVKFNQLECLKLLVEEVGGESDFLNSRDFDGGMTILQLALKQKQIQTIRYLLSLPIIRAEANTVNGTTLDFLEKTPEDFRALEIQQILMDAGIKWENKEHNLRPPSVPPKNNVQNKNVDLYCLKYQGRWLEEKRGMLMVAATMITTMTFQAAMNPPGGVWQQNVTDSTITGGACTENDVCLAGTAVLGYGNWKRYYQDFIDYNTISFFCSLNVTLVLMSGIPLQNPFSTWMLSLAMFLTVSSLVFTYQRGMYIVSPKFEDSLFSTDVYCYYTWMLVFVWIGALQTLLFLIWLVKRLRSRFPTSTRPGPIRT